MPAKRKSLNNRPAVIERLRLRDGEDCWLCQTSILFWPHRHPDLGCVTIDHVLPVSLGGDNHEDNLKLAHYLCNNTRGDSVDAQEIKTRIATLFVDGIPATVTQRREMLLRSVARREPAYPFCAYPRQDRFAVWPYVDDRGNVRLSSAKPSYLH